MSKFASAPREILLQQLKHELNRETAYTEDIFFVFMKVFSGSASSFR